VSKRVGTDGDATEYGKRLEKLLRSRNPGRDDSDIREEMLEVIAEIDSEFESPGIVQVVAAEKLARSYVRTKDYSEACRVEREAVAVLRSLGRTNETLYFERLNSLAQKLITLGLNREAGQLFDDEVPRSRHWPAENVHELHIFLRVQAMHLQSTGRFDEAALAFSHVAELGVAAFGEAHSQYYPIMRGYVDALLMAGSVTEACSVLERVIDTGSRTGSMDESLINHARRELEQMHAML
jgi:hypothetical protein